MQKLDNHNKKTFRKPWDYFHDCHICQGMKQGRGQTTKDLEVLFEEAEQNKLINSNEAKHT